MANDREKLKLKRKNKQQKLKAEIHSLLHEAGISIKGKTTAEINELTLGVLSKAKIANDKKEEPTIKKRTLNKPFKCSCGIEVTIYSDEEVIQNKCSRCLAKENVELI